MRLVVNATRFLFFQVLHYPKLNFVVNYPKREQRIPELLTRDEVHRILNETDNLKYYTEIENAKSVDYLFYGSNPGLPVGVSTVQKTFTKAKRKANIKKRGGIHGLRHAYISIGCGNSKYSDQDHSQNRGTNSRESSGRGLLWTTDK